MAEYLYDNDYINDNELFDKLLNLGRVRKAFDKLVYPDFNDIGELNKEDAELFLHCMKVLNTSETNIKDYKLLNEEDLNKIIVNRKKTIQKLYINGAMEIFDWQRYL